MTESKKIPAYTRGKYKPSEKPRKKRALVKGSIQWWISQEYNEYQARKIAKQWKNQKANK